VCFSLAMQWKHRFSLKEKKHLCLTSKYCFTTIKIAMAKIAMIVEKTTTGYSVYARDYDFATAGNDWVTLLQNKVEAANLFFEDLDLPIQEDDLEVKLLKYF
jgi:hypothetical protein